ncbi:MAG: electron transport complex subunit E [Ruminococcus sp.]|nr:electron transport complex subunit E [Ruminococcus sp.]MDE7098534.1 electron transport complex subunit E [Ruminococcus sp.]
MSKKNSVFDGLFGDNTVLSSLMVISPVIMCGDKVKNALALIYAFSAITFISVLIGSFVPKKLPYAVKITIYAFISSLVYIPVKLMAQQFFPTVINRTGIYFMLLAVNSLIMVQTETKFYRMKKSRMFFSLIFYILGFDVVMLITSVLRELIAYGTVYEKVVDADILISGIGMPFGGFVFLGLFCGLYRKIRFIVRQRNGGKKNVSGN